MRTAAIIISIIIAIVRARRTVRGARLTDIARNCVFLIPLIVALAGGAWIAAAATVVVYGINFYMS